MDIFTCDKRVVRGGVLVCFEGQVMSVDEAEALGLAGAPASPESPAAPKEPTAAEIKADLDALGIAYDKKAKKDVLKALLAEAQTTSIAPENPAGGDGSADKGAQADQANGADGAQADQANADGAADHGTADVPPDSDSAAAQADDGGDE